MSPSRFNHVYLGLLALSALCAFVIPRQYTNLFRGRLDGLFEPVAYPIRALARQVAGDSRPAEESACPGEIEAMRNQIANLTAQLEELRRINANRELMGDARKYSLPFKVIGGERDALIIQGTARDGLGIGTPVVLKDGVVGRVAVVGNTGAQVLLITDPRSRIAGAFGRFRRTPDGRVEFVRLDSPPPLVEGRGSGLMGINNLSLRQLEAAGVKEGDWVVLWDDDWKPGHLVKGYFLGHVQKIQPQPRSTLWADVIVRPRLNLHQLGEVMAVVGQLTTEPPSPAAPQRN